MMHAVAGSGVVSCTSRAFLRSIPGGFLDPSRPSFRGNQSKDSSSSPAQTSVNPARAEQQEYVVALRELGHDVTIIEEPSGCSESPFVGDLAITLGNRRAVILRPSNLRRMGEEQQLLSQINRHRFTVELPPDASIDGGDVLVVGSRVFIAASDHTNARGIEFLMRVGILDEFSVTAVSLRGPLRLRQLVSPLDDHTVLKAAGRLNKDAFAGLDQVIAPESQGANVIATPEGVLVSAEAPRTIELLSVRFPKVRPVPFQHFLSTGAYLSRLSVRL